MDNPEPDQWLDQSIISSTSIGRASEWAALKHLTDQIQADRRGCAPL